MTTLMNQSLSYPRLYTVQHIQYLLSQGPDMINSFLRTGQPWEEDTLAILYRFLADIDRPIFLDIGVNLGAITVPIGKYIEGKNGKVYSIEAQRNVFYQLCGNIFANNLTKTCFAYHLAISDYNGHTQIPFFDTNTETHIGSMSLDTNFREKMLQISHYFKLMEMDNEQKQMYLKQVQSTFVGTPPMTEMVQVITLDTLDLPCPDLIKIDVENLEYEVLQGAKSWLKKCHYPPIVLEIWLEGEATLQQKRNDLLALLDELGYEIFITKITGIAQHRHHKRFTIDKIDDENFDMSVIT